MHSLALQTRMLTLVTPARKSAVRSTHRDFLVAPGHVRYTQ